MGYSLTQKEFVDLKRRLTLVQNKAKKAVDPAERLGALRKVVFECRRADEIFQEKGYPDSWSRWERAGEDARFEIERLLRQYDLNNGQYRH